MPIIEPLLSRFLVLEIPEYTFEEFKDIAVARLTTEKLDHYTASFIADKVWNEVGSRDIRDVVKVGRLADSIEDVSFVVSLMKRQCHNCDSESRR